MENKVNMWDSYYKAMEEYSRLANIGSIAQGIGEIEASNSIQKLANDKLSNAIDILIKLKMEG